MQIFYDCLVVGRKSRIQDYVVGHISVYADDENVVIEQAV